jgi:hypothetical protein
MNQERREREIQTNRHLYRECMIILNIINREGRERQRKIDPRLSRESSTQRHK